MIFAAVKDQRHLEMISSLRELFQREPVVNGAVDNSRIALILFLSGIFGFCIGTFGSGNWQLAVERAQVVVGVVDYPRQTPYYLIQTKIWTLLHQIAALFFLSGLPERTVSSIFAGLEGMFSYQALSLCVLALSRDPILALASPVFIHFTMPSGWGIVYPISLIAPYTHGVVGLSFALLVVGLFSVGQYKLGGLLLGIAPALHPSLGMLLWLTVLICFVWDFRNLFAPFKGAAKYILLGCSISAVSLTFHLLLTYDVPKVSPEIASKYLHNFIRYWDNHRQPVSPMGGHFNGLYLTVASLTMSVLYLRFFKQDIPGPSLFLLRTFVVSAILGFGFAVMTHLPLEMIPNILLIMNLPRWLNLNILGFMPLLIGLLGRYKRNFWVQCSLAALIVILWLFAQANQAGFAILSLFSLALIAILIVRARRSGHFNELYQRFGQISEILSLVLGLMGIALIAIDLVAEWLGIGISPGFGTAQLVLTITGGLMLLVAMDLRKGKFQTHGRILPWLLKVSHEYLYEKRWLLNASRTMAMLVFGLVMIKTGIQTYAAWRVREYNLRDWTNDPLFAQASKGSGILLTSSNLHLIQVCTRRPVLLDGNDLDSLPYALEAGPEMDRVLRQVYGVDLFNPDEEVRRMRPGGLLPETGKTLWESWTGEQWLEIRKEFGVTEVLTYADWKLKLPEVIRSKELVLYRIPGSK